MKGYIYIWSCIVLGMSFLFSCNSPDKSEAKPDNVVENKDPAIEIATDSLDQFYKKLNEEEYNSCVNYFSEQLFEQIDTGTLIQGLVERNKRMGIILDFSVIYKTAKAEQAGDTLYIFHTKCYNQEDMYHFENICFVQEKNQYVIKIMEYSNLPYVSIEMANDKSSDLNLFLKEMYKAINSDKYSEALKIIDEELIARVGEEKLKYTFENQIATKEDVNDFVVEDISARIKEGIPVIEMIISENTKAGTYKSEVLLAVRKDRFTILKVEDISTVSNDDKIKQEQQAYFSNYVDGFYSALRNSNYEEIVNYIDEDVFLTNSREDIKRSFILRNEIHGIPKANLISEYESRYIYGKNAVIISVNVESANSQTTEKITLIEEEDGNYHIYGYEYPQDVQK